MKPVSFDYVRAPDLAAVPGLLAQGGEGARVVAGGQSLGPMLNLRLATPSLLVDIGRLPELTGIELDAQTLTIGACVTHAAIEDGRVPDIGGNVLPGIAARIAYRAVRNRGTIGGSLAHADPAADWVSAMTALGATVITHGARGGRAIPMAEFVLGAFRTALLPGEIVQAVRIPLLSPAARWGWYKVCRKPGEFATAMGAVLRDPGRGVFRAVMGATGGRPLLLDGIDPAAADAALAAAAPELDAIDRQVHGVALRRAARMLAP